MKYYLTNKEGLVEVYDCMYKAIAASDYNKRGYVSAQWQYKKGQEPDAKLSGYKNKGKEVTVNDMRAIKPGDRTNPPKIKIHWIYKVLFALIIGLIILTLKN